MNTSTVRCDKKTVVCRKSWVSTISVSDGVVLIENNIESGMPEDTKGKFLGKGTWNSKLYRSLQQKAISSLSYTTNKGFYFTHSPRIHRTTLVFIGTLWSYGRGDFLLWKLVRGLTDSLHPHNPARLNWVVFEALVGWYCHTNGYTRSNDYNSRHSRGNIVPPEMSHPIFLSTYITGFTVAMVDWGSG